MGSTTAMRKRPLQATSRTSHLPSVENTLRRGRVSTETSIRSLDVREREKGKAKENVKCAQPLKEQLNVGHVDSMVTDLLNAPTPNLNGVGGSMVAVTSGRRAINAAREGRPVGTMEEIGANHMLVSSPMQNGEEDLPVLLRAVRLDLHLLHHRRLLRHQLRPPTTRCGQLSGSEPSGFELHLHYM
eukprot:s2440_g5.t1